MISMFIKSYLKGNNKLNAHLITEATNCYIGHKPAMMITKTDEQ